MPKICCVWMATIMAKFVVCFALQQTGRLFACRLVVFHRILDSNGLDFYPAFYLKTNRCYPLTIPLWLQPTIPPETVTGDVDTAKPHPLGWGFAVSKFAATATWLPMWQCS